VTGGGRPERPARVLILGDSVTQGRGGDRTWRYWLWKALQDAGAAVDFVGPRTGEYNPETDDLDDDSAYADPDFDQDHAAQWGDSMALPAYDVSALVTEHRPDVVVNDEGYNDLAVLAETPAEVVLRMQSFVAEVRAVDNGVDIVLGQLPHTWRTDIRVYNALLLDLVQAVDRPSSRVVVAPAPGDFVAEDDTYDGTHPSPSGEVKIARQFAAVLVDLLVSDR
jgi:lysophospholipase L1-like esterase